MIEILGAAAFPVVLLLAVLGAAKLEPPEENMRPARLAGGGDVRATGAQQGSPPQPMTR
jgi:hypothetical protein